MKPALVTQIEFIQTELSKPTLQEIDRAFRELEMLIEMSEGTRMATDFELIEVKKAA